MENSKSLYVRNNIDLCESASWDLFAPYALFKEEFIDHESEKEVVLSYVNAVNLLNEEIKRQNHSGLGVVSVLRINTLTIPFMFLVRHTVELIIKHIRKGCQLPPKRSHHLTILWNEVAPIIKQKNCGFDDNVLSRMTDFILAIDSVDDDGTKTRYSHDNKGKVQNKKPLFINCENINTVLQIFAKLIDVDFEETKNESTN